MIIGSKSGGIVYHARAFLYNEEHWRTHREGVAIFLNSLSLSGIENLYLVGPSGGYSLPTEWLKKFKKVYVYEPDYLARLIFKLKHNVGEFFNSFNSSTFSEIANSANAKQSLILFSNVLGQIDLELQNDPKWSDWIQKVAVASYHDAFSVEFPTERSNNEQIQTKLEFVDLINRIWEPGWGVAVIHEHHVPNEDHGLKLHSGWVWQITPHRIHWIEGVYTAGLVR